MNRNIMKFVRKKFSEIQKSNTILSFKIHLSTYMKRNALIVFIVVTFVGYSLLCLWMFHERWFINWIVPYVSYYKAKISCILDHINRIFFVATVVILPFYIIKSALQFNEQKKERVRVRANIVNEFTTLEFCDPRLIVVQSKYKSRECCTRLRFETDRNNSNTHTTHMFSFTIYSINWVFQCFCFYSAKRTDTLIFLISN